MPLTDLSLLGHPFPLALGGINQAPTKVIPEIMQYGLFLKCKENPHCAYTVLMHVLSVLCGTAKR